MRHDMFPQRCLTCCWSWLFMLNLSARTCPLTPIVLSKMADKPGPAKAGGYAEQQPGPPTGLGEPTRSDGSASFLGVFDQHQSGKKWDVIHLWNHAFFSRERSAASILGDQLEKLFHHWKGLDSAARRRVWRAVGIWTW